MTCHEAQDLIEAVAAGDEAPPPFAAHVAGCHDCAGALEMARAVERTLGTQPEPAAPAEFTRRLVAAIRRQRWEYDEHVDRAFNVAIAAGIALVVVAIVSLMNVSTVAQMLIAAGDAVAELPQQTPSWGGVRTMPTATIVMTVVVTAVAIWWWAERRSDFQEG
jgi:hypothetical protein